MTGILAIREICEAALREIGNFPISATSADPVAMTEAARRLDLMVGHLSGTNRIQAFVPEVIPIPLTPGIQAYQLANTNLSSGATQSLASGGVNALRANKVPLEGFQFLVGAYIRDPNAGNDEPLTVISQAQWDELAQKDATGTPYLIQVDRSPPAMLRTWPIVQEDGWTIYLRVQTFAPDQFDMTQERRTALERSWNLWTVTRLAYLLGRGPIMTLPEVVLNRLDRDATRYEADLLAYQNDAHPGPRISRTFDYPSPFQPMQGPQRAYRRYY